MAEKGKMMLRESLLCASSTKDHTIHCALPMVKITSKRRDTRQFLTAKRYLLQERHLMHLFLMTITSHKRFDFLRPSNRAKANMTNPQLVEQR